MRHVSVAQQRSAQTGLDTDTTQPHRDQRMRWLAAPGTEGRGTNLAGGRSSRCRSRKPAGVCVVEVQVGHGPE